MFNRVATVLVAALIVLTTVPTYAISFDFYQVDWMSDPGVYLSQDSDWGRVEVELSSADDGMFHPMVLGDGTVGRGGFINIYTDADGSGTFDREIYNLPIFYEDPSELDGRLPQGAMFDLFNLSVPLGSPTNIASLNYDFTIDPIPVPIANPLPALSPVPSTVNPFEVLTGGDMLYMYGVLSEGGGVNAPAAAKDLEAVKDGEKIGSRASIAIPETSVATVNEDKNGCAPGSVARSIKYMSDANSNVNVPDSAGTVYGELYGHMKTNNGKNGTYTSDILKGKDDYVRAHNLPIVTTQTKNFKKAMETLANKGDVEIGIRWGTKPPPPAGGTNLGAHRAFVSEIQEITDASGNVTGYVVKTIDDPKQGDGTAANKTHTARFDANGNLVQYDGKAVTATGAKLINFQTEDVHASTVTLDFWGCTVTCPVLPGGYVQTPLGEIKIPLKRPGETTSSGLVKIRYEGATSPNAQMITSELVANPEGIPDPANPTLAMDVNVDLVPPVDPLESTIVNVGLNLEHLQENDAFGKIVAAVEGGEEVFLENILMGGSFFDITYEIEMEGEAPQVFRLHGEISEEFLESVWFLGVYASSLAPPDPDFAIDSFFDVFFELEISPEAYPLLEGPGMSTLVELELTDVQFSDLFGDANFDGKVDEEDATILASNWLTLDGTATWSDGDFNGDGNVDEADASLMAGNWLMGVAPPASAPEPGTLVLIGLGLIMCLSRRSSRCR